VLEGDVGFWHNVRAQLGAFEGTKAAALPTFGIKGWFTVYGAGLEPMSALANSTFACGGGNQSSSILSMSQQGECRPWGSGVEEG
jgi:hypothetical protein